jgi:tRNA threonylcarbamoyladenosine biosynthesis protein TsaB
MLCLALDTAGPNCAVALAAAGRSDPIARAEALIGRGHAEHLMPLIERVLSESGTPFADLGRVAVTVGPGSFTGIRVGVAAARGLALALAIPAVGVGSLVALAQPALRAAVTGTVVAALDAGHAIVYWRVEEVASGAVLEAAAALPLPALAARLAAAPRPLRLTGPAAPAVVAALGERDAIIVNVAASPDIADVAALAFAADAAQPPVPLYLRAPDARPQRESAVARR